MKKTIAVDLDGVLAEYHEWKGLDVFGPPLPGARLFLIELRKVGEVVIYTTRCCEELNPPEKAHLLVNRVRQWLDRHNMPYDHIWSGQGKPIYACIIDDRAIPCEPQRHGEDAYVRALERAVTLCELAK
jgi:hypothetical protein